MDQAIRPEKALLGIRKAMGLYAKHAARQAVFRAGRRFAAELWVAGRGTSAWEVVRELIGGIYFGDKGVEEIDGEKERV